MVAPQIIRNRRNPPHNWGHLCIIVIFASLVTTCVLLLAYFLQNREIQITSNKSENRGSLLEKLELIVDIEPRNIPWEDGSKIFEILKPEIPEASFLVHNEHVKNNSSENIDTTHQSLIKQFREAMKNNFTQDYMNTDHAISMWLIEANWDLDTAIELFMQNLEWREEYKMDGILDEDFGKFPTEYPMFADGVDKEGRPVLTADMAAWDVRRITVSGKGKIFTRYVFSRYEYCAKLLLEIHAKMSNVTSGVIVFNLEGFNMIQHGCFHCIKYYVAFIDAIQYNYPGFLHKMFLINVPDEFDFFLSLMPAKFEHLVNHYGSNRAVWQPKVLELINPDQIRHQFGGTKKDENIEV